MDWNELVERLNAYEWNDIEFKKAKDNCPKNAFETVSSFANTSGGWLVFGVEETNCVFTILGVEKVEQVASDFFSALRSSNKLSFIPDIREGRITHDTKTVLTFFVPEVPRDAKPVYLHGDIRQCYVRKAGADQRCSPKEIERFMRDRSDCPYDSELLPLDVSTCFDDESLHWYRTQWQSRNGEKLSGSTHLDFLKHFGLIGEADTKLLPTRASILLFGSETAVMSILPRPIADFRRVNVPFDLGIPDDKRWDDRGIMECNLINSWRGLLAHYSKAADLPFSLDSNTLERKDKPCDYTAFREALINLLTHQDYGDQTRKASIQIFRDRTIFWNPGSAFVTREEMFTPGDRPVRNPRIVNAFRRIGLGDQAGTGMGAIYSNWRQLKRIPPLIDNDKSGHAFSLHLLTEEIVSKEQLLFQAKLGVHLTEDEAALFTQVWREGKIWPLEARAITGRSGADTDALLKHLVVQGLLEERRGVQDRHYILASHLRELANAKSEPVSVSTKAPSLVTEQAGAPIPSLVTDQVKPLISLTAQQQAIVQFCDSAKPIALIMRHLGVSNRTFFRRTHLEPLVNGGILKPTFPDSASHPKQAYVLTDSGFDLKKKFDKERQP